jgi:hypothetical protein
MADQIVEITRDPLKGGLLRFHVLYLYPLAEPVVTLGGKVVKLTPSDTLPPEVVEYELLGDHAAAIMAKFEDGTGCFRVEYLDQMAGETLDAVLLRVQRRYSKGLTWIEQQRARYANAGRTHDAT